MPVQIGRTAVVVASTLSHLAHAARDYHAARVLVLGVRRGAAGHAVGRVAGGREGGHLHRRMCGATVEVAILVEAHLVPAGREVVVGVVAGGVVGSRALYTLANWAAIAHLAARDCTALTAAHGILACFQSHNCSRSGVRYRRAADSLGAAIITHNVCAIVAVPGDGVRRSCVVVRVFGSTGAVLGLVGEGERVAVDVVAEARVKHAERDASSGAGVLPRLRASCAGVTVRLRCLRVVDEPGGGGGAVAGHSVHDRPVSALRVVDELGARGVVIVVVAHDQVADLARVDAVRCRARVCRLGVSSPGLRRRCAGRRCGDRVVDDPSARSAGAGRGLVVVVGHRDGHQRLRHVPVGGGERQEGVAVVARAVRDAVRSPSPVPGAARDELACSLVRPEARTHEVLRGELHSCAGAGVGERALVAGPRAAGVGRGDAVGLSCQRPARLEVVALGRQLLAREAGRGKAALGACDGAGVLVDRCVGEVCARGVCARRQALHEAFRRQRQGHNASVECAAVEVLLRRHKVALRVAHGHGGSIGHARRRNAVA